MIEKQDPLPVISFGLSEPYYKAYCEILIFECDIAWTSVRKIEYVKFTPGVALILALFVEMLVL